MSSIERSRAALRQMGVWISLAVVRRRDGRFWVMDPKILHLWYRKRPRSPLVGQIFDDYDAALAAIVKVAKETPPQEKAPAKKLRRHERRINNRHFFCQSCRVDQDGNLEANLGISNDLREEKSRISGYHIQISPDHKVTYSYFVEYELDRFSVTHSQYDEVLKANLPAVEELIVSLLEPVEVEARRQAVDGTKQEIHDSTEGF